MFAAGQSHVAWHIATDHVLSKQLGPGVCTEFLQHVPSLCTAAPLPVVAFAAVRYLVSTADSVTMLLLLALLPDVATVAHHVLCPPHPQTSTATQQAGAAGGGTLAPTVSLALADMPGPGSAGAGGSTAAAGGGYSASGPSQLGGTYGGGSGGTYYSSGGTYGGSSAELATSQAGSQGVHGSSSQRAEQLRLRRRVYGWAAGACL